MPLTRRTVVLLATVILTCSSTVRGQGDPYDILITGARLMDGLRQLANKYRAAKQRLEGIEGKSDLIGQTDSMQQVKKLISKRVNTPTITKPLSVSDAKKAGFTVLEKRDEGTYEKL